MRRQSGRGGVRCKVRTQKVSDGTGGERAIAMAAALPISPATRLLQTYAALARRGEHLLGKLLAGRLPRQWQHYPEGDALDSAGGYQWFYHAHAPADRPDSVEHGHLHVFARRKLWSRRLQSAAERALAGLDDDPGRRVETRHLLGIGLNAKGVPTSLFTVNSWVTGDLMLSAENTVRLLEKMNLDTGHREVDAVIEGVLGLYRAEIRELLARRDARLFRARRRGILRDQRLEVLSELAISVDDKLAGGAAGAKRRGG